MLHNLTITYKIKSNNKILLDLRSKSVDEANQPQMMSKAENEPAKVQISSYAAAVKSSSSIPKVITKIKVEDCSPHETNKVTFLCRKNF
ncbi:hypothetical protein OS493_037983 [Desmophyllum pertusum]|uniref:Uncharacterized protein n=1 Tax=Desmophyllum pertusum TaxID=174260 RepID=A0A9W9ZHQ5_9CNID|nr:hypothetical protein OS493_037983 [Desmophyllum pertusum]